MKQLNDSRYEGPKLSRGSRERVCWFLRGVAAWLLFVGLVSMARSAEGASSPGSRPGLDYDSFRLIWERSIFDPNRRAGITRSSEPERETTEEAPPRSEYFALLGTLSYEKGSFAYFNGSSSDYRATLSPEDSIAGWKIKTITQHMVRLENEGKAMELPVGKQMTRHGDGPWEVETRSGSITGATGGEDSRDSGRSGRFDRSDRSDRSGRTNETGKASESEDDSEVLKLLMQKREQELNNEKK